MYTLYFAPDNASLIVRIVLEELAVPYDTVLVDRAREEQRGAAYRRLNPRGLIPVLIMDDEPVFETAAIVLALAERHGRLAPEPGDPQRAGFLKWLFFLSNGLHQNLRLCFYPAQFVDESGLAAFERLALTRLQADLGMLEKHLVTEKRTYCCGEALSVVDIYLAACLRWMQLYPRRAKTRLALSDYPGLLDLARRVEERPAVVRACVAEGIPGTLVSGAGYPDGSRGAAL